MPGTKVFNTDIDLLGTGTVTGLRAPTAASDATTKQYVDGLIEGTNWKASVRSASIGNLNLASPGATIDGITMVAGDRFLAKDQTTGSQNGVYIWNGSATPATRAPDCSTARELEQAVVVVEEGTVNAATSWRQSVVNATLDTTTLTWVSFGSAVPPASETVEGKVELATQAEVNTGSDTTRVVTPATLKGATGIVRQYATDFGDGSATSYVITHGLNTRDIQVTVRLAGSPYDEIICEVEATSTTTCTIKVNTAPTASQYRAVVQAAT